MTSRRATTCVYIAATHTFACLDTATTHTFACIGITTIHTLTERVDT